MLKMGACAVLVAAMIGCGDSGGLSSRVPKGYSGAPEPLNDGVTISQPALNVRQELRGVNADGENAVIRVSWSLTDQGINALQPNSQVRLRAMRDDTPAEVIETQPVSEETPAGTIDVPVNTEADANTQWYIELDRANLTAVPGITNYSVLNLSHILSRNTTALDKLQSVELSLVPESYSAENIGNRREHEFTVAVSGELDIGPDPENSGENRTKSVFVTGLLKDGAQPFILRESGILDTESPLSVTDQRKDPLVYLVMDASSSMMDSECSDDLYHAISSTVITLAPSVNFNYRIFDNEVYEVESTLEFLPIEGEASGSALYYALDTVVADIEKWENRDRDIFIIAYSDGLDLASWNHYNFASRDAVVAHVGRRLHSISQQHFQFNGRTLKTFLMGFDPRTGSEAEEMYYLATRGGGEYIQLNRDDCNASIVLQNSDSDVVTDKIEETFLSLTDHISSVYHINYSSQQTHGHSQLSLELNLGDSLKHTLDLPPRPIE